MEGWSTKANVSVGDHRLWERQMEKEGIPTSNRCTPRVSVMESGAEGEFCDSLQAGTTCWPRSGRLVPSAQVESVDRPDGIGLRSTHPLDVERLTRGTAGVGRYGWSCSGGPVRWGSSW